MKGSVRMMLLNTVRAGLCCDNTDRTESLAGEFVSPKNIGTGERANIEGAARVRPGPGWRIRLMSPSEDKVSFHPAKRDRLVAQSVQVWFWIVSGRIRRSRRFRTRATTEDTHSNHCRPMVRPRLTPRERESVCLCPKSVHVWPRD